MILVGGSNRHKDVKPVFRFMKMDTVRVDSMLLPRQKIKVSVEEADFEEIYWTDEEGNIELRFEEIIPEPADAYSVLRLIIRYEEMVDTVKVRRL